MKIRIDIDTTPAEVREFFGLPNLKQLQEGLVDSISEHMKKGAAGFDPFTVMKSVWPTQLQTIEALQNAFVDSIKASAPTTEQKGGGGR